MKTLIDYLMRSRNAVIVDYVKNLPPGSKILDVGCTDMGDVNILKPTLLHREICKSGEHDVRGLDINEERVKTMVADGFNCIAHDLLTFESSETFDLIIAGEIIEHISNQDALFSSLRRLLSVNGKLLISTPNPNGVVSVLGYWLIGRERFGGEHVLWQSPKTIEFLGRKYGLKLNTIFHCYWDYRESWMLVSLIFELFNRMKPTLLFEFIIDD